MAHEHRSFIPAAGFDWLLPLYDPLQHWILGEDELKRTLIAQADLQPGQRVLDVGCGTGTLTVLTKSLHPEVEVLALDPDSKAIAIARDKAARAGMHIDFEQGFADKLPYADASLDRVFSSLMFHHLVREEKIAMLREVSRVLKPGASLHLLDFGEPRSLYASVLVHLLHGKAHLRDNLEGKVTALMHESGFRDAREIEYRSTWVGTLSYFRAAR